MQNTQIRVTKTITVYSDYTVVARWYIEHNNKKHHVATQELDPELYADDFADYTDYDGQFSSKIVLNEESVYSSPQEYTRDAWFFVDENGKNEISPEFDYFADY